MARRREWETITSRLNVPVDDVTRLFSYSTLTIHLTYIHFHLHHRSRRSITTPTAEWLVNEAVKLQHKRAQLHKRHDIISLHMCVCQLSKVFVRFFWLYEHCRHQQIYSNESFIKTLKNNTRIETTAASGVHPSSKTKATPRPMVSASIIQILVIR